MKTFEPYFALKWQNLFLIFGQKGISSKSKINFGLDSTASYFHDL